MFWVARAGETGGWGANLPGFCTEKGLWGGRLLWLVCGARAVVEVDQLQPIRWRAHSAPSVLFGGEGTENRQIWVLGEGDLRK